MTNDKLKQQLTDTGEPLNQTQMLSLIQGGVGLISALNIRLPLYPATEARGTDYLTPATHMPIRYH